MLSIRAAGPTIHHEAIDWATRVSANGGTISTTVLRAVSDFCAAADRGAFRSAMYRLNLFCGGNLSGCLVPLYRSTSFGGATFGNATDTNNNFVSADFIETGTGGGLKGNGTTKWLGTGAGSNVIPSLLSSHLSVSGTGMEAAASGVYRDFIGVYGGTTASTFTIQNNSSANRYAGIGNFSGTNFGFNATEAHAIASRTSATAMTSYRSGVSIGTDATSAGDTRVATQIGVFGRGDYGASTAATLRMYSFGNGLNATQAAAFSAAVIAFNNALGR
jgi:hypothetical protein